MEKKLCYACKKQLSKNMFYRDKSKRDGYMSRCKECEYEYKKRLRDDNKNKGMTISELSRVAGCNYDTAKRKATEMFGKIGSGRQRILTKGQAIELMSSIKKTNFVNIDDTIKDKSPLQKGQKSLLENDILSNVLELTKSLAEMTRQMSIRMDNIENKISTEPKQIEAPMKTTRQHLRQLVNDYADKANIEYREAWNELYTEAYYRMGINIKGRARNAGVKPIDFAENALMLEDLKLIIIDMIGGVK